MTDKLLVLVTCGKKDEAGVIARALIEQRLAACVSVLPVPVLSTYRWKNRIEANPEDILLIKTSRKLFRKLEAAVKSLHTYKVPEIIALPIGGGSKEYLRWMEEAVKAPARRRR
jgi:periplasmic divalent cation tolerance protein